MPPFPSVRSSHATAPITSNTVTAILQVVNNTSLEALEYATESIITAHKNAGSPSANVETINKLMEHTENMRRLYENMVSPWDVQRWEDKNIVQLYNEVLTEAAVNNLVANMPQALNLPISMIYTLDEQGQFLRVYFAGEEPLDEERTKALDALWNLWLTQNSMICQDGFIYRTDKNGANTKDRIQNAEFSERIGSLEDFFIAKNVNIALTHYQAEPSKAVTPDITAAAKGQKGT